MGNRLVFLVCEHFVKEVNAAISKEGADDILTAVLPARCGRPPLTSEELSEILTPIGDAAVEVFGGCCLASLPDTLPGVKHFQVHKLDSCFEFIADPDLVRQCLDKGLYLTSPGWLAAWPDAMEKLGLTREIAREMFAETTTGIVLFDTGVNGHSAGNLKDFAAYVERPFESLHTGLSVPRLIVMKAVLEWRIHQLKKTSAAEIRNIHKQSATYAMAIDLLANLARIADEPNAVEAMLDVYAMLFAPGKLTYLSFENGLPDKLWARPQIEDAGESDRMKKALTGLQGEVGRTESRKGFFLRIIHRDEPRGVIAVDDIAFPEHIDQYLNLALGIVNICELPIENARKYQKLIETEEKLRKANEDLVHIAATDALTGIANRRAYDEHMEIEWKKMLRNRTPLSLIVCDIDFFKRFNDLYGHNEGDICLLTVAQLIRKVALRPGDFVARYGGEEFVVVLPETPLNGAFHLAEKIRTAVFQYGLPHERSEAAPYVTLSLGIAEAVPPVAKEESPLTLFRTADDALYEAKRSGRNRSVMQKM